MWKFIVRRIFIMIPQMFLLSILVFILAKFMPGDALTGQFDPNMDPAQIDILREKLGMTDKWYIQYWDWIKGAVQGDFGQSFRFKMKVTDLIQQRMTNTIWLALLTLIFTYLIAIPLGITSGRYNDTWGDRQITGYTYMSFVKPYIYFALFSLWLFVFLLGWFTPCGCVQS